MPARFTALVGILTYFEFNIVCIRLLTMWTFIYNGVPRQIRP